MPKNRYYTAIQMGIGERDSNDSSLPFQDFSLSIDTVALIGKAPSVTLPMEHYQNSTKYQICQAYNILLYYTTNLNKINTFI